MFSPDPSSPSGRRARLRADRELLERRIRRLDAMLGTRGDAPHSRAILVGTLRELQEEHARVTAALATEAPSAAERGALLGLQVETGGAA
jgi:hypothetical protein